MNSDVSLFSGSMVVFKGVNATLKFNSSPLKIGIQGPKRKGLSFSNHHFSSRHAVSFEEGKWDPYFEWIKLDAKECCW